MSDVKKLTSRAEQVLAKRRELELEAERVVSELLRERLQEIKRGRDPGPLPVGISEADRTFALRKEELAHESYQHDLVCVKQGLMVGGAS